MVDKKCQHCNCFFKDYKSNNRKYCCRKCYENEKWHSARIIKHCLYCGCGFYPRKQDLKRGKAKYCSVSCYAKMQKIGKKINCITCNKEFYVSPIHLQERKYCSRECRNIYPNTYHLRQKIMIRNDIRKLGDTYVKSKINSSIGLRHKDIPKELVELKRLSIKRKRKLNEITHGNSQ